MICQSVIETIESMQLPGRSSLRKLAVATLCLTLLGQSVWLGATAQAAVQEKQRVTKKKKKTKKQVESVSAPMMLPRSVVPESAGPAATAPAAEVQRSSKREVTSQALQSGETDRIESQQVRPQVSTVVTLRGLTSKTTKKPGLALLLPNSTQLQPEPQSIQEVDSPQAQSPSIGESVVDSGGPLVPSPGPTQQFQGEFDEAVGGGPSGTFTIPPDTTGAVGLDKVVSYVNNNIVVHNKATGARLSVAGITAFWSSTGATGVFDPRVLYDPYNNRWIVGAVSNAQTANSSILIGVSQTSDPEGAYSLFRFIVGCAPGAGGCNAAGEWADFPMVGFNKNWVGIGWNPFTINTGTFISGKFLALDYPTLRTGTANGSLFTGVSAAAGGFCLHPATTFSATEETLYVPTHIGSAAATYRLHRITGTPAAPVFNLDPANRTRTGGGWTQPGGDILPQQCIPGVGLPTQTCPASIRRIDSGDAFIRSNVIFRNGRIYYPQTIGLPAGGLTRTAAQWTALNPDGSFSEGGRIDDPTATATNGGKWYAYPGIAVNKNNDVILGFSEFESDDYADAGYTFRLGSDAPGTMRDPLIFKEGEDYYSKTFSGTRNRWGDYSHAVVDPVNDRDLWTMQEYAMLRVGTTGQGTNDSRWGTWWAKVAAPAGAGDLLISEFRVRGPSGANDEFIEIYNPTSSPHNVTTGDGSAGYAIAASDGVVRATIPAGTVIPARGHYLAVNSVAYSLASYPAGSGTTATGDVTYTTDIPDNAGIALFSSATTLTLATRIDAVGSTSEANTLYKEGTGYPALTPFSIDYSFYRSYCPGNTGVFGTAMGCFPGSGGLPKDTDNNSADFVFVDTNGTSAGAGQRLGAPGPENLSSPIDRNATVGVLNLDSTVGATLPPNRVRDFTSDPANNSTFGTLDIRRRIVNSTGAPVTRLRFRIIDFNTFPAPTGFADLRTRTSTSVVVSGINDTGTCSPGSPPCTVTVEGTVLEQPPSQPNGGGFNSSQSVGSITLGTPLANGASVNIRFLVGIQQTGSFRFFLNVEAAP